ncbi:GAF domain-containing protein [uncultured Sphingomonas sp.]|uniref:sensor histidine kinase n=1 Tax=uncultured Sphingomonas sp. TaxID=158754 RepID=UPI0025CD6A28|nr:GAF domain-containing protein [uncultured Sphingomonas sp.]
MTSATGEEAVVKAEVHDETDLLATLARKNAVLQAINRIFHEALGATTEEALGRLCLAVAEDLTGAAYSFMAELTPEGDRLHDLAISDRGWAVFRRDWPHVGKEGAPTHLDLHGLYGRVIKDDASLIANDARGHPDAIGVPHGHPPLLSFLGVPLRRQGKVIGVIGLGNRAGGFREIDRLAAEELAPAIVQALGGKRTEVALRESEDMRRVSIELVPAMLWRTDEAGNNTMSNSQWAEATGQSDRAASAWGWLDMAHPDDRAGVEEAFRQSYTRGEALEHQVRLRNRDGDYRWFLMRQVPRRDAQSAGMHWFGAATDVHDLHLLEERQRRLVAELQHRVRNILTVVRSVFARTVEAGGALDDVADHFRGRLDALARTQAIVTQTASGHVDLENLIRDELLSVGVADGEAMTVSGPDVPLPARAAEAIGLAVHELAINAVKYGALKVPGAMLDIAWSLCGEAGDCSGGRGTPTLCLTWVEKGVPAVPISPSRQGFGTELICEALPYQYGARTDLAFVGGGVRCRIELPLCEERTTF